MSRDDKIHVLIDHANPLVSAGLEAAFRAREGFRLVGREVPGAAPDLASVSVAVTDCDTGMRMMSLDARYRCSLLILTEDATEISIRRAVELGIRGYLPLASPVETVVRAVRNIHLGARRLRRSSWRRWPSACDPQRSPIGSSKCCNW